jgi:hypothetical protein
LDSHSPSFCPDSAGSNRRSFVSGRPASNHLTSLPRRPNAPSNRRQARRSDTANNSPDTTHKMPSIQYLGLALLAATRAVAVTNESRPPQLAVETVYGCYSDPGDLVYNITHERNSLGFCVTETCKPAGFNVAATMGGNECYCGNKYPSKKNRIADSECNVPCQGYDLEACKFPKGAEYRSRD